MIDKPKQSYMVSTCPAGHVHIDIIDEAGVSLFSGIVSPAEAMGLSFALHQAGSSLGGTRADGLLAREVSTGRPLN